MSDYSAVDDLMTMPVATPKVPLGDKGYDGDNVRSSLLMRGILLIIPPKSNRREPIACDFRRYRGQNRIERLFGHLKHQPRIVTRYDKTALSFASFLNLAAIRQWIPNFVNKTWAMSAIGRDQDGGFPDLASPKRSVRKWPTSAGKLYFVTYSRSIAPASMSGAASI